MNIAAKILLFVSVMTQPTSGTQTALSWIPGIEYGLEQNLESFRIGADPAKSTTNVQE